MVESLLVAFDGSPLSRRALTYAIETFPDAHITSIYVINPVDALIDVEAGGFPAAEDWYENAKAKASTIHQGATDIAGEEIHIETVTTVGTPARAILEYARNHDTDQIIMGSHGRSGIDRALLGSVAETVTRRAGIPVTIIT